MKLSTFAIAIILFISVSCGNKKANEEHGHPHESEAEHGHAHDEDSTANHHQEEFKVESDSAVHTHEDGNTHSDH
jgi:hypothetical protein